MIEVDHLTKRYGAFTAVDDISFQVGKGEIVGFLGPNGAGKTTTMRVLTCFLPATEGTARIAGHDIFGQSIGSQKNALDICPNCRPCTAICACVHTWSLSPKSRALRQKKPDGELMKSSFNADL